MVYNATLSRCAVRVRIPLVPLKLEYRIVVFITLHFDRSNIGSIPITPTKHIEIWCNGSTCAFGAHSPGSSPGISTIREVTKVLSTGALEASVSGFDSHLLD